MVFVLGARKTSNPNKTLLLLSGSYMSDRRTYFLSGEDNYEAWQKLQALCIGEGCWGNWVNHKWYHRKGGI
jgi:hypothetical protein